MDTYSGRNSLFCVTGHRVQCIKCCECGWDRGRMWEHGCGSFLRSSVNWRSGYG